MKFLDDPRQFAFGKPTATMQHATGAYRVNFAMGTNADGKYRSYIPEADASSRSCCQEGQHYHSDARIDVIDFTSKMEKPVAPYYRDHLEAMGLPMQVTGGPARKPQLSAAGIDVNGALADVLPLLTPDESTLLCRHPRQARSPAVLLLRRRVGLDRAQDRRVGRRARPARRRCRAA